MASPERLPRELSLLYSEDEQLDRPEKRPRTVSEVAAGNNEGKRRSLLIGTSVLTYSMQYGLSQPSSC